MSRRIAGHSVRPALVAVAVVALVGTVVVANLAGESGWWIALGLLAPDLLPLVAFRRPERAGQMPRSMVPWYNATHSLIGPVAFLVIGLLIASPWALVLGGSWLTHIVWDRAVGYGLRNAEGENRASRPEFTAYAERGIPQR